MLLYPRLFRQPVVQINPFMSEVRSDQVSYFNLTVFYLLIYHNSIKLTPEGLDKVEWIHFIYIILPQA